MRKIDQLLEEYGQSHQNMTNKWIHWICVPAIFFSVLGMAWGASLEVLAEMLGRPGDPLINMALVGVAGILIYYFTLSVPLMLGMTVFSVACLFLANILYQLNFAPLWGISLGIFFIAWAGQFYGHKLEGEKPSFFKDIQFLLIGPAWLMHFLYKKVGIRY